MEGATVEYGSGNCDVPLGKYAREPGIRCQFFMAAQRECPLATFEERNVSYIHMYIYTYNMSTFIPACSDGHIVLTPPRQRHVTAARLSSWRKVLPALPQELLFLVLVLLDLLRHERCQGVSAAGGVLGPGRDTPAGVTRPELEKLGEQGNAYV